MLACHVIRQSATILMFTKPIGPCGTQNAEKNFEPDRQFSFN